MKVRSKSGPKEATKYNFISIMTLNSVFYVFYETRLGYTVDYIERSITTNNTHLNSHYAISGSLKRVAHTLIFRSL
jgi:hypothetical protein